MHRGHRYDACVRGSDEPAAPIVRELGAALFDHLDDLNDRVVGAILDQEPDYAEGGKVTEADLRSTCRANLERVLQSLTGLVPAGLDPCDTGRDTGRRRAQQGMPLESVLHAYRLGGRLIWEAMVQASRDRGNGVDHDRLLDAATSVWQVIDEHSTAVGDAYRLECSRLRSRDLRQQQALLDALVDGRGDEPAFARDAARILSFPSEGPMLCVVATIDSPGNEPLRTPFETLRAHGVTSIWQVRAGTEFGLVTLGRRTAEEVMDILKRRAAGRVGVSPVFHSLGAVPVFYRLAELTARTVPQGVEAVVSLDDRLPEALVANSPDLAARLVRQTAELLLERSPGDRRALLDTVGAVVANDGSISRAAAQLFCHRNTVMYRLRRVEAMTGKGVSDPRDKLLWTLALLALRQQTAPGGAEPAGVTW